MPTPAEGRNDEGNLFETLAAAAADRHEAAFLIEPEGATTTYGDILARAAAMSETLRNLGAAPGDRVVVRVAKSVDAVALYLGCLHAGVVHVPLNPAFTAEELDYFVDDASPTVIVVEHRQLHEVPVGSMVTSIQAIADKADRTDATHNAPTPRRGDDLAALLYTSGTTGRPKGAALTHDNLRHNARALHDIWHFHAEDHLLHTLPIFHVHGLFVALHCAMLSAAPVTFLRTFDIEAVLAALPRSTVLMGVPTHYGRLLADPRFDREATVGMRLFTSGSAPLPSSVFDEFTDRTGHRICERYGMSEAGIITSNPYDGARLAGTVGHALPGVDLRVVDDEGQIVPSGVKGAVEVRGPHLFVGYWNLPDATVAAHHDGWFRTGDIGSLAADGRLTLQGRAGDMIISGGENIYPKEIELVLDAVPGVVESAVIGVPHPDLGEGVTALLVVDADYAPDAIDAALQHALGRFKHPKATVVVDELPLNAMGKVQKHLLRAQYATLYSSAT